MVRDNGARELDELLHTDHTDGPNLLESNDPNLAAEDTDDDLAHLSSADDAPEDFTESAAGSYHSVTDGEVD